MATHADADLIIKLYDLRREDVCREARKFFINWSPTTVDEVKLILNDGVKVENAYIRQITTYWEMAFSLVNTGAIDATLFSKNCGEGILCMVKCQYLAKKFPGVWIRTMPEVEAFVAANESAHARMELMQKRFA